MTESASAFDGVRVVEVSATIGPAMAAWMLSEQGADVVRVIPPGAEAHAWAGFRVLDRGKRSVVLDVESEAGRGDLWRLLERADVFLYDWGGGEDHRLGFSGEAVWERCPGLVIGYLSAYGSRGRWAGLPADEALVQAVSAVCDAQYRYEPRPVLVNMPVAGYGQGIVGALSVAASLYARTQTQRGDRFELSQIAATFAMETIAWLRAPSVMRLAGQQDPRGPIPTYRLVQGSDGQWLFCGALTPPFWAKLAIALGLDDCLVDERFRGAPMGIANMDDRRELARRVSEAFLSKPRDEWLRILEEADVPRAPVLSREEWARDPHVAENGMMVEIDEPSLGRTLQMGLPMVLRNSPGRVRGTYQQIEQIDQIWGSTGDQRDIADGSNIEHPASDPASRVPHPASNILHPLQGITVIDLSGFIAGASASMMLADFGARVIKVEPPDGDGWRSSGLAFLGSNRGKRSVCIDLKRPEGRELLLELIDGADVLHDNFRHGVMDRMGFTWELLSARNPRLIWSSVTGYGPSGPLSHLPGFDPMMQSRGGVMRAQGEPGGEPVYLQMPVCDYGTALTAAFGIVAALHARERTGAGDRVETSLAHSALTMQAGEMLFYDGEPPDMPGGRDLAGHHALYRVYGASDGWLMVACTTAAHAEAFARGAGVDVRAPALGHATHGELAAQIEGLLAARTVEEWLSALLAAGVPAATCVSVSAMFDDEHLCANELWWDAEHPQWGLVRQTGALVHWDEMSMHLQRRSPLLGEHTAECLSELGIGRERIEALLADGVLVQGGVSTD